MMSREIGTAMSPIECDALSARIDLDGLRGYWHAVTERTRGVVHEIATDRLLDVVDATAQVRATADGVCRNERTPWLDGYFAGRTKIWFLSFLNVHNAEHLIGEALAVRGQNGTPLGL
jgi:hypothetical protein